MMLMRNTSPSCANPPAIVIRQSAAVSQTPISNDGSGDEEVTINDSPTVAVKLQASPTTKKED